MKVYCMIPVSRTALCVEQPGHIEVEQSGHIEPAVAEKPALIPNIEGKEHVFDNVLIHQKRRRSLQLPTLVKCTPCYDVV